MMHTINGSVALALLGLATYQLCPWLFQTVQRIFFSGRSPSPALEYSEFLQEVEKGQILAVTLCLASQSLMALSLNGRAYRVALPGVDSEFLRRLSDKNIALTLRAPGRFARLAKPLGWVFVSFACLPFILPGAPARLQGDGRSAPCAGLAIADGSPPSAPGLPGEAKLSFADIGGYEEVKRELVQWTGAMQSPERFKALGVKCPTGILLVGPEGTGKQALSKAVAGEAQARWLKLSRLELEEAYAEEDPTRIQEVFEATRTGAPCVLFLEALEVVSQSRGPIFNQLLKELSACQACPGVLIMASTRKLNAINGALLRPGRFQRILDLELPNRLEREAILALHTAKRPLTPAVDLSRLAQKSEGFSGERLVQWVNESALEAISAGRDRVAPEDFEQAADPERVRKPARYVDLAERTKTAYHEAGHAIVGLLTDLDPLDQVTIIPRIDCAGVTIFGGPHDEKSDRDWLEARLARSAGGRIAEELIYGKAQASTGPTTDINFATDLARDMVIYGGFSEALGPICYADASDETGALIDAEVKLVLDRVSQKAYRLLSENMDLLHAMKAALLAHGTLYEKQARAIMARQPFEPLPEVAASGPLALSAALE